MDSLDSLLFGILNNDPYADRVGQDEVGPYTIDTCLTADQGYETAVWYLDHELIIVARYETREEAVKGHEDWCTACRLNPTEAWSVQLDRYISF